MQTIVNEVIAEKSKTVLDYRGGSRTAIDRLIAEVLKRSGGKADPRKVRRSIINKL